MDFSQMTNEEIAALHTSTVKEITRLNNAQMSFKILLNSAYGALG